MVTLYFHIQNKNFGKILFLHLCIHFVKRVIEEDCSNHTRDK